MVLTTANVGNWYYIYGTPTEVLAGLAQIHKEKVAVAWEDTGVLHAMYALN